MALRTGAACLLALSTAYAFHTPLHTPPSLSRRGLPAACGRTQAAGRNRRLGRVLLMSSGEAEPKEAVDPRLVRAEKLAQEMRAELPQLCDLSYEPKWELYADQVQFIDPLTQFEGVAKYKSNIQMLKDSPLFGGSKMDLHDAVVQEDGSLITRWTLAMTFKLFPWQPRLIFTGTSQYFLDDAGLVIKHVDKWDSIDQQDPFSTQALKDLVKQMLPDITKQGVQILKGGAAEELTYAVVRKAPGIEIRKYDKFEMVLTEDEGVYSRETYESALDQLRAYRGDALTKPSNKAGQVLPAADPLLQIDNGSGLTSLGYVHATSKRGKAPKPMDKGLRIKAGGDELLAVFSVRGFGADRTRSEDVVQRYADDLKDAASVEGYKVLDGKDEFTIASYSDGYEIWVRVEAKPEALRVRSER